jgi:peptidoglycan/xylan/chitin deacetylase (PgdA/CDA1 family)
MNLVSFSVKTKGVHTFVRRLWTVFTRFGFSEKRTRRALYSIIESLQRMQTNAVPTFFIPAVVLNRHPKLIARLAAQGIEIGIHGYVHNDYRWLTYAEQYQQTKRAVQVFKQVQISTTGFRNPYLGWTDESHQVFAELGLAYASNDAVLHEVIDLKRLPPLIRRSYEKSLTLFQATACTRYTLRPHFMPWCAPALLSIPVSLPDDEELFDRLRITEQKEVGRIWSSVMQRVYALGGIYTLNLHPERGVLCREALDRLIFTARSQTFPIWITPLAAVAEWWKERSQFRLNITPQSSGSWLIEATCSPRATVLARYLKVVDQPLVPWADGEQRITARRFIVQAQRCPSLGLSPQTSQEVFDFLQEEGYSVARCAPAEAERYAWYLDSIEGLGNTRQERIRRCSALLETIEHLEAPLVHFGYWPQGQRAALSITGDIDSVTIQDFFLRILEVSQQPASRNVKR